MHFCRKILLLWFTYFPAIFSYVSFLLSDDYQVVPFVFDVLSKVSHPPHVIIYDKGDLIYAPVQVLMAQKRPELCQENPKLKIVMENFALEVGWDSGELIIYWVFDC